MKLTHASFIVLWSLFAFTPSVHAQSIAGERHALLIGGLGGSPEYTDKFKGYLYETRKALIEQFQFEASQITILGETAIESEAYVDGVSNAENIRAAFADLGSRISEDDHVYVFLFGHGGYENNESRLNIPRRDLTQHDFAQLVDALPAGRIVFVNTSSASAPFIEALSGDSRVVVTATRAGTQKNETSFPRFMIEAFTSPGTDRDKDGRMSIAEVFTYAAEKTDQWFDDNGNIPTETALLDDNADKEGHRVGELEEGGEGYLAGVTYLTSGESTLASAAGGANTGWLREREQIEVEIASLKSQKADLEENEYYDLLEVLMVRLARGNVEAEQGN